MAKKPQTWIECTEDGRYCVKNNSGVISYHETYESAKTKSNFHNNEGAFRKERFNAQSKKRAERREKELKKAEDNRKAKRSNDKYVYVISLIERGSKVTQYFIGETNILKMKNFATNNESEAKVFNTKASAQKVVDVLTDNVFIKKLYRNLKVVQKKRELFK